jgi:hypothetical protein
MDLFDPITEEQNILDFVMNAVESKAVTLRTIVAEQLGLIKCDKVSKDSPWECVPLRY